MAFDYKKEYKEFYLPPRTPGIVTVPAMHFLAVRGAGDPNAEGGAYKQALELLYAVAFTIKMSKLGQHRLEGYFDYVVPPLEGLWWQEGVHGVDYARKADFQWISLIRLPEFVTEEVFHWAIRKATEKKKQDFSRVEFFPWEEGLCVQCMHLGLYDDEPATVTAMDDEQEAALVLGVDALPVEAALADGLSGDDDALESDFDDAAEVDAKGEAA